MRKIINTTKLNPNKSKCGVYHFTPHHTVLQFKTKRNSISDKDIMSLFMGIIRLVRENERTKILSELQDKLR